MKTTVTELPESRVRVEAEVPPEEVERAMARTARALGRSMRIPGFRKGKIPPPVVIRRIGREAVLDETVRDSIGRWYADAIGDARISPVGEPDLKLPEQLPGEGEAYTFTVEIGVRPKAKLGTYKGIEVGRREPRADEAAVQAELEALRERAARLETVDREAREGDFVVMDYVGSIDGEPFEGGAGRDQMVELGSGRLIPGFEEQLTGAKAGEERTVKVTFPQEYGAQHLAGRDAEFAVTVKEVREKVLPELDDDFAVDQAGFDSLDELREDIAAKLKEADERAIDRAFREAVVDAVAKEAEVDIPASLVEARARELWDRMLHSLAHQGISKDAYLQIAGKSEEELLEEAKPEAETALRREAVVAAVVEAEGIEPSDGDILDALQASAVRENVKPEKLRDRLEKTGRLEDLKEDLAARAAIDLLVEEAKPISVEQAKARDKLWTPDKDEEPSGETPQLWTPGS
ncbi:MAG: trigger factor [Solirubrobacteraceae bacterium]|nr:trigger factor [Solirubrobacteraceae bacterium]